MKIRMSYVSNSSSSSYCIIGKEICHMGDIISYLDKIEKNKKYVIMGIDGNEGEQLINLKGKEVLEIFKNRRIKDEFYYCDLVEKIVEGYDGDKIEVPNITLNAECFYGTCDNYEPKRDEFISEYTTE